MMHKMIENNMTKQSVVSFMKRTEDIPSLLYETDVFVNTFGTFYIMLAPELISSTNACTKEKHEVSICIGERGDWLIHGSSLVNVIAFIDDTIAFYEATENSEKLVIQIFKKEKISYLVANDNVIYASDSDYMLDHGKSSYGNNAKRRGSHFTTFEQVSSFGIEISARVYLKKISIHQSRTTTEYSKPILDESQKFGKKLNTFDHLSLSSHDTDFEFPYSEKLAEDIYNTMIGMCELNNRFDDVIRDARENKLMSVKDPLETLVA